MKTRFIPSICPLPLQVALALLAGGISQATTYYWDGTSTDDDPNGGSGTWDTSTSNWELSASGMIADNTTWPLPEVLDSDAVFGGLTGVVTNSGVSVNDITFNTAGYDIQGSTLTFTAASTLTANADATISSSLAGNFNLIKEGSGKLTLSTAAARTGSAAITTTINNGVLRITAPLALSTGTAAVTVINTGGTLELGNSITHNQPITFNGGTLRADGSPVEQGKMTVTASANVTYATVGSSDLLVLGNGANDISGGAGATINITGPGTVRLNNGSDYTGNYNITGATTQLNNGTSLGASTAVTLATGSTLSPTAAGTSASSVTISGAGTANYLSDRLTAGAGQTYTLGNLSIGNQTLSVANSTNVTSSNANITHTSLTLTGNATFDVDVVPTANNMTLLFQSVDDGASSFGMTKNGDGNLQFPNANTFDGGITINNGFVVIGNNASFGTGTVTLGNGAFRGSTGITNLANAINVTGTTGRIYSNNNFPVTLNGAITGSGTLNTGLGAGNDGANTVLTISNDLSGFNGTLVYYSSSSETINDVKLTNGSLNTAAKFVLTDTANISAKALFIYGDSTIGELSGTGGRLRGGTASSTLTVNQNTDSTFAGQIENSTPGTLGLTKTGTGNLTLSAPNLYTGNTIVSAGTLTLAATGQLKFALGATSGDSNSITGAGTAVLNGSFAIDTTAAAALSSGSWTLENVDTLTGPYGASFSVAGFTDAGSDKWTLTSGSKIWTFDETTGVLELTTAGYGAWADANAPGQSIGLDHDNDGVDNGIEYFMGLSGSGFTPNPTLDNTDTVSWPKGASYAGVYNVNFKVQVSDNLTTWVDVEESDPNLVNGNPLTYKLTGGTKRFVRLDVTGP